MRKRLHGIRVDDGDEMSFSESGAAGPGNRQPVTYTEVGGDGKHTEHGDGVDFQFRIPANMEGNGASSHIMKFYDCDVVLARALLQDDIHVKESFGGPTGQSFGGPTGQSFGGPTVEQVRPETFEIEFPFRLTECECRVVNMKQTPEEPIILLGRSGTGKTTCCIYRMFAQFVTYWRKSGENHTPLIPGTWCGESDRRRRLATHAKQRV